MAGVSAAGVMSLPLDGNESGEGELEDTDVGAGGGDLPPSSSTATDDAGDRGIHGLGLGHSDGATLGLAAAPARPSRRGDISSLRERTLEAYQSASFPTYPETAPTDEAFALPPGFVDHRDVEDAPLSARKWCAAAHPQPPRAFPSVGDDGLYSRPNLPAGALHDALNTPPLSRDHRRTRAKTSLSPAPPPRLISPLRRRHHHPCALAGNWRCNWPAAPAR